MKNTPIREANISKDKIEKTRFTVDTSISLTSNNKSLSTVKTLPLFPRPLRFYSISSPKSLDASPPHSPHARMCHSSNIFRSYTRVEVQIGTNISAQKSAHGKRVNIIVKLTRNSSSSDGSGTVSVREEHKTLRVHYRAPR